MKSLVDTLVSRCLSTAVLLQREVVLVVNDPDRDTPTGEIVSRLLTAGVRARALVACGTHQHSPAQRERHQKEHLAGIDAVCWHDADRAEITTRFLGTAPVLGIGSIEPHYFAGWTGAHKTLSVGIWPRARIQENHQHAVQSEAQPARLDGNPVFEDLRRQLDSWCAKHPAPVRAVNLLARDGDIVAGAVGAPLTALEELLPQARDQWIDERRSRVDRLLARVEPPLSRSLYQAMKGVENHAPAVRDGGALVLEARCDVGVGIDHWMEPLRRAPTHQKMVSQVALRGYRLGDHKALRLRHLTDVRGVKLAIVSPVLLQEEADRCGAILFRDRSTALEWARQVAPGPEELIVRRAANTVTLVRETHDPETRL